MASDYEDADCLSTNTMDEVFVRPSTEESSSIIQHGAQLRWVTGQRQKTGRKAQSQLLRRSQQWRTTMATTSTRGGQLGMGTKSALLIGQQQQTAHELPVKFLKKFY